PALLTPPIFQSLFQADSLGNQSPRSDVTLFNMSEDLLLPNSENPLIWINPQRLSGAPCFYKTRLPIDSLFDNLEDGVSLDEWLDAFPDITRAQAQAVLEL